MANGINSTMRESLKLAWPRFKKVLEEMDFLMHMCYTIGYISKKDINFNTVFHNTSQRQ